MSSWGASSCSSHATGGDREGGVKGKGTFHPGGKQSLSKRMEHSPGNPHSSGVSNRKHLHEAGLPQNRPKVPTASCGFLAGAG